MKKLALSLSVALLALAAPAFASSGEARSVSVKTADLNLSSAAGVEALYSRIQGAARKVCSEAEGRSAARVVEHRTCLRTAMDSGVIAADNAALSALHLAKTGPAPAFASK